jgi:hypothetical protein
MTWECRRCGCVSTICVDGWGAIPVKAYDSFNVFPHRLKPTYQSSGGIGLFPSHSYTFRMDSQNLPHAGIEAAPPAHNAIRHRNAVSW